jgi:hypothetical protein
MSDKIQKVAFGSDDRPLKIGGLEIQCYVLEDGTRVLSQMGVNKALSRPEGGSRDTSRNLPRFLELKGLSSFIDKDLEARVNNPIIYQGKGGKINGVQATLLPEICDVWLKARDAGILKGKQLITAKKADIIMRGLAHIGIIALVDEVTGYQEIRDRQALQIILDKYITDEWAKWTKTFPDEYYKELFRLKNMEYPPRTKNKPSYIGHWTNDIVYKRLAPAVLTALKDKNPKNEKGNRTHKLHQSLTRDYGHPKLQEHLANIIFLMKGVQKWSDFERVINRAAPRYGETIPLDFPEKKEDNE